MFLEKKEAKKYFCANWKGEREETKVNDEEKWLKWI